MKVSNNRFGFYRNGQFGPHNINPGDPQWSSKFKGCVFQIPSRIQLDMVSTEAQIKTRLMDIAQQNYLLCVQGSKIPHWYNFQGLHGQSDGGGVGLSTFKLRKLFFSFRLETMGRFYSI